MIKIVFKVNGNCINAYKLIKDTPKEDLNKTNVIDTKELVFSDVYIKNNLELVSSFLNVSSNSLTLKLQSLYIN